MKRQYKQRDLIDRECVNPKCGASFQTRSFNSKYCNMECRDDHAFHRKQAVLLDSVEGYDYVIDMWNGFATPRVYGAWFKTMHPNRTMEEYRAEFPDAKTQCDKINEKNGQFMKDDKWRKWASDKMKGEGNINHSSNTSIEERKSRSPFSKSFVKYKNEEDRQEFIKSIDYSSIVNSSKLEWWVKKCNGNVTKAEKLYKERQSTFTLEKCILRYGKRKGTKIFNDRQTKWLKNFPKTNYSKISQEVFIEVYNIIKDNYTDIYFATLNKGNILEFNNGMNYEYTLKLKNKSIKPDFFIKDIGKIIEFDGVYWHRINPENTKREAVRDEAIISSGYEVYHINESDYHTDPEKVIEDCIKFLNN